MLAMKRTVIAPNNRFADRGEFLAKAFEGPLRGEGE